MAKEAPATGTQAGLGRSSDPCWPSKVTAARADQPFASGRPVDPGLAAVTVHHQDRWLVVVNKPAGLLTQPGLGPEQRDSLVLRLQARWPELRLVHRLDRDTSGLLLLARDSESHRQLSRAFAERQIQKRYFARVLGSPEAASGTIDLPIMKLSHQPPLYGVAASGRPSLTHWQRHQPHAHGPGLLLQPITGRSHQLRVHLQAIGHPILGDPLYGQPLAASLCTRLCLHACGLAFRHPATGEWLSFASPARFPSLEAGLPPPSGAEGFAR